MASTSYAEGLHKYVQYVERLEAEIDKLGGNPTEQARAVKRLLRLREERRQHIDTDEA